jgi:hypothetical protein
MRSSICLLFFFLAVLTTRGQTVTCPPENKDQLKSIHDYIAELQSDSVKFNAFIDRVLAHEQYSSTIDPVLIRAYEKSRQPGNTGATVDRLLTAEDWNIVKDIVCQMLLNKDLSEVITAAGPKKDLRFVIDSVTYNNRGVYNTMHTNTTLLIRVEKVDTASRVKLKKIKWKLNGTSIPSPKPDSLQLVISRANLPNENNSLTVYDSAGAKISELTIKVYYAPVVKFTEGRGYQGEYLFDKGYDFPPLAADPNVNTRYQTITVGKNNDTYYAPVLGLLTGDSARIRVDVRDLANAAKADRKFKLVFKPRTNNIVRINNRDSLVVDGPSLNSLTSISVLARNPINGNTLTSMIIDVLVQKTRKLVGQLEYYCAVPEQKVVRLIYTKCSDEGSYPTYLPHVSLQTFLNEHATNQLFINFRVDTLQFPVRRTTAFFQALNNTRPIMDTLERLKFGPGGARGVLQVDEDNDYYFITGLSIPRPNGAQLGGFHATGGEGGVQMQFIASSYGETSNELTAHELGHWQGLPHTWETNAWVNVRIAGTALPTGGGLTGDYFMDYNVRRKRWFKIHLLNYRR